MTKPKFAIGLLFLLAATQMTAAEPKPDRVVRAAPLPPQVMMQVVVLQVDCEKLKDSDFNLAEFFTLKPNDLNSGPPAVVNETLNDREVSLLLYLLKSKGVGEILSRPQVMTLEGQEATVQVGAEVALLAVEETINGKTASRVETRPIGIMLNVTPTRCTPKTVQLNLSIGETKYYQYSSGADGQLHPLLKSQKIDVAVEAALNKTLLIADGSLFYDRNKDDKGSKLLIAIKPILVESTNPPVSALPTAIRARDTVVQASAPHVRSPGYKQVRGDSVAPAVQARARTEKETNRKKSVRDELRLLRSDVESLRTDVKRLIDLLETRNGPANNSSSKLDTVPQLLPIKNGKATPEACVELFVSSAQSSESEKLLSLLTQKARLEWTKVGLTGQRLGSHDGITCEVGKATYPSPDASVAQVPSIVTTLDDGRKFAITWHLLRENEGWRIKGMTASISPGLGRKFFDFENPAGMIEHATQEAIRRFQKKQPSPPTTTPARPSTSDQGSG